MLVAALRDQVYLRIHAFRTLHQAGQGGQLQPDEMLAGEEPDKVRGGEYGPPVDELHRGHHTARVCQLCVAREGRLCVWRAMHLAGY